MLSFLIKLDAPSPDKFIKLNTCIWTNIPKCKESQNYFFFFFFLNLRLKKQMQLMIQCHYCSISANTSLCLSMKHEILNQIKPIH